jgi:hypothetical protein
MVFGTEVDHKHTDTLIIKYFYKLAVLHSE